MSARAGRVRVGATGTWRVTTSDARVASTIAALLGGIPQRRAAKNDEDIEVVTRSTSLEVAVVQSLCSFDFWEGDRLVRTCSGQVQRTGQPCVCPPSGPARRDAAAAGTGCVPRVRLLFTLVGAPEAGQLALYSGAWGLHERLTKRPLQSGERVALHLEVTRFGTFRTTVKEG